MSGGGPVELHGERDDEVLSRRGFVTVTGSGGRVGDVEDANVARVD